MFGNLESSSQWLRVIDADIYNLDPILKYSLSNTNPIYETYNSIEMGGELDKGLVIQQVVIHCDLLFFFFTHRSVLPSNPKIKEI